MLEYAPPRSCGCGETILTDRLWAPAGSALTAFEPLDAKADRWTARFSLSATPADDAAGLLAVTVIGRRDAIADFIASGGLRLELFDVVGEFEVATDRSRRSLVAVENTERSMAVEWFGESRDEPAMSEAERSFEVKLDLPANTFAVWSAASAVAPVMSTEPDSVAFRSAAAFGRETDWVRVGSDGWTARSVLEVDVTTGSSAVDCYPADGGGAKTVYSKDVPFKPIDMFTTTVKRNPVSNASRVYYKIQGTDLRRK